MGLEALSVLSAMTRSTLRSRAASMTFCAPLTFVLMVSKGLYSAAGTCLSAAAWTTMSTPSNARDNLSRSRTSPRKNRNRGSAPISCWNSYCLSSSRLNTTTRLGECLLRIVLMKARPNEPVPPVTRTDFPSSTLSWLGSMTPSALSPQLPADYTYLGSEPFGRNAGGLAQIVRLLAVHGVDVRKAVGHASVLDHSPIAEGEGIV